MKKSSEHVQIYRCRDDVSLDLFWIKDPDSTDMICLTSSQLLGLGGYIIALGQTKFKGLRRMPEALANIADERARVDGDHP